MKAFVFPGWAIPREGTGGGGRGGTEDRAPSDPATGAGRAERHSAVLSGLTRGWGHISCSYSSGHQKVKSHTHSRTRGKQGAGGDWVSLAHLALQVPGHIGTDGPGG